MTAKVMDAVDGVYHLAGILDPSPEGLSRMTTVHILERALLRASEQAKVRRFVHCSSSITVGFSRTEPIHTEDCEDWHQSERDSWSVWCSTSLLQHQKAK